MGIENMGLRFGRRKTDDAFRIFHLACDAGDLNTASDMLLVLEDKFSPHLARGTVHGDCLRDLLQAQARLWSLRCSSFGDVDDPAVTQEPAYATELPATSKVGDWLAWWLRRPRSRFERVAEFAIRR